MLINKIKKVMPKILLNIVSIPLIFVYYVTYIFPRDKRLWLFGSMRGRVFADNPKYFFIYLNSLGEKTIKPVWVSRNKKIIGTLLDQGFKAVYLYSIKGFFYVLRSGVFIFDHYTDDICFWLSGGSIKINLWHGIPLKKINYDNQFDKRRIPRRLFHKVYYCIDKMKLEKPNHYFLTTTNKLKPRWNSAFKAEDRRILACGYPRNDIFFKQNIDSFVFPADADIFFYIKSKKVESSQKLILYMPTFRKSESEFNKFVDLNELNNFLLTSNAVLIIKVHPMSKIRKVVGSFATTNIKILPTNIDPYPFLYLSDILITDYSSVFFDFLHTDRPIIFFPYDFDEYISENRKLYYRYDEIITGNKALNMEDLMSYLGDALKGKDGYKKERSNLRESLFDYTDGESSQRLYEELKNRFNL